MLDAPLPDAFDRIEDFLAANRGLPADLYLGYGLAGAGPPEPCPLPGRRLPNRRGRARNIGV